MQNYVGRATQLVMRHVQAHVTGESRKQLRGKIYFNTEDNEHAVRLDKTNV